MDSSAFIAIKNEYAILTDDSYVNRLLEYCAKHVRISETAVILFTGIFNINLANDPQQRVS